MWSVGVGERDHRDGAETVEQEVEEPGVDLLLPIGPLSPEQYDVQVPGSQERLEDLLALVE